MKQQEKSNETGKKVNQESKKGRLIAAIDVHLKEYVVAWQEGTQVQGTKRMQAGRFIGWIKERLKEGWEVVSCYEAGPLGFVLHRELEKLGVRNLVIRARNWDEHHRRVKTDERDARGMLVSLDRYLAGQIDALTVVMVPSLAQEQKRSESRLREQLKREVKRMSQQGRSLALYYGVRLQGVWIGARRWEKEKVRMVPELVRLLEVIRKGCLVIEEEIKQLSKKLEEKSRGKKLPKGMGAMTAEVMEREVVDWNRFKNRRQAGSFVGLTPWEDSSGERRCVGHLSRAGHSRLRYQLVELAWRLYRYQPEYRWVKQCKGENGKLGKKKLIGLARRFFIDWWRIQTGQMSGESVGLEMMEVC